MHYQLVLRGAFGEELVLASWMNATRLQRACAVEPHRAGHLFQQQLFLNRDFFQRHRSNILSLPNVSSPLGSHRMSDAELQRMVLDHLTRSGRLILVNVGLAPCGLGPKLELNEPKGPPDAGPGWRGDARSWTQEPDWAHVQLVPNSQLKRFKKVSGL